MVIVSMSRAIPTSSSSSGLSGGSGDGKELLEDPTVRRVMAHHSTQQDAGRVFSRARPRLAVYTHMVLLSRPSVPALTEAELMDQTRETYDGPLKVGADLMCFDIRLSEVSVWRQADRSTARS
jgi:ribonuclease Z